MTPFTVISSDEAEAELARLWLNAKDRKAVTAAQHQIDRELASDPHRAGTELSEGLWQIRVPPVKAFYEIDDQARIVRITNIGPTS
jgi:mRNA-degrading endonuclease RelE of RelBE toxin-antitoxin system